MPTKLPKWKTLNPALCDPNLHKLTADDLKPEYDELYSIGEIYSLKMILTRYNKPVKSKSHVSKIVRSMKYKEFISKTGHKSMGLTIEQINEYNKNKLK
jgi:hypothetical protein